MKGQLGLGIGLGSAHGKIQGKDNNSEQVINARQKRTKPKRRSEGNAQVGKATAKTKTKILV
jgi:hypothetical protein